VQEGEGVSLEKDLVRKRARKKEKKREKEKKRKREREEQRCVQERGGAQSRNLLCQKRE